MDGVNKPAVVYLPVDYWHNVELLTSFWTEEIDDRAPKADGIGSQVPAARGNIGCIGRCLSALGLVSRDKINPKGLSTTRITYREKTDYELACMREAQVAVEWSSRPKFPVGDDGIRYQRVSHRHRPSDTDALQQYCRVE